MKKKLSKNQVKAAEALAAGSTHSEAAREANVSSRTILRWLKNKEFLDKIQELKDKAVATQEQAAEQQLQGSDLIHQALTTLQNVMLFSNHDAAKVSAAKYILERYERIEDNNTNSNTPNIMDFLKSRKSA